jgi:hypothetical protein
LPPSTHPNPESSFYSRFLRSDRGLRIGVLSDAGGVQTWLASVIESLTSRPEMEIGDLFLLPDRRNSPDASPPWLFRKLEAWSRSGANGWFDLSNSLPPPVRRQELTGEEGPGLTPEDRALITARQLDILLCATALPLRGDCANLARLGVWSFLFGEPEFTAFRPPYWREVYEGRSVSRAFLLAHNQHFERGRVIESFATGTLPSLRFTLNQVMPLRAASSVLDRSLLKAAADRETALPGGEEIELGGASPGWPSTLETAAFVGTKLTRSAALRLQRGKTMRWFVGIRRAPGAIDFENPARGEPFLEIQAPPGHYYADPFIVESDSRHWLFVEDWIDRNGRACLTCLEVRDDGSFGEPVVILDKPYHLSYPHVFSHRGDFFMIPESCENSTVQLYRAKRFPFEWDLEAILLNDAALADTTAFHYDGKWYFFTGTARQPDEEYLFTADRIDGPWQYHPANPICTDTRRLRGAGAIFSRQNMLIRPSQDCSLGYGYAMTFNEIRRLSPVEYEERQVGRLLPGWAPGVAGAHTFNFNSRYEVVDWTNRLLSPTETAQLALAPLLEV